MVLTKEQILAVRLRSEVVDVPEWGGEVRVWELPALRLFQDFERRPGENAKAVMVRIVAACIGDDSGPVENFPTGSLGPLALERLFAVAARLNVVTLKAAEEVRGNSEGGPGGSSPTGSP